MGDFLRALSLLTRIPVRASWEGDPPLGKAAAFFPLVGAVIGVPAAALALLLGALTWASEATNLLSAALVLLVLEGLTGFLHLDGWADCCDGLLPALSRERRLEIMKDPRLGCFGVTGIVLLLMVKLAALAAVLSGTRGLAGVLPVAVAPALSRSAMVVGARAFPLARSEGMAALLRRGLGPLQVIVALALGMGCAALLGWRGAVCAALALLAALGLGRLAKAKIGGSTGDVYGATSELAETLVLVACAFLRG